MIPLPLTSDKGQVRGIAQVMEITCHPHMACKRAAVAAFGVYTDSHPKTPLRWREQEVGHFG